MRHDPAQSKFITERCLAYVSLKRFHCLKFCETKSVHSLASLSGASKKIRLLSSSLLVEIKQRKLKESTITAASSKVEVVRQ
jgi:hypothetical protein